MDKLESVVWDLAGLTTQFGMDRPIQQGHVAVPEMEFDANRREIKWSLRGLCNSERKPAPNALEQFLTLGEASDEAIFRFAQRNGTLRPCQHDLPCTHNWPAAMQPGDKRGCFPVGWPDDCRESVDYWQRVSVKFAAAVDLAAWLHDGRKTTAEQWKRFDGGIITDPPQWKLRPPEAFCRITDDLNHWLMICRVTPMISCVPGQCEITFYSGFADLSGYLGVQLAAAIALTEGQAICSECGMGYLPKRKPNPNRRRFCGRCKPAAWKHSKRDLRRKNDAKNQR